MIATSLVVAALAASAPPAAPPPDDPEGAFRAWAEREEVELSHTACDVEDGGVTCYGLDQYRTAVAAEWIDGDFALVLPIEPDPLPEDTVPSISVGGSPDIVSGEAQQILLECAGAIGVPETLVDGLASGDSADFDNAVSVCAQAEVTLSTDASPDTLAVNLVRAVNEELESIATDHAAGMDVSSSSSGGSDHVEALSTAWRALAQVVVS
jgi:hypothetical protein